MTESTIEDCLGFCDGELIDLTELQGLAIELALLRRKARALDELALRVQGRWPCVLVQLHSDHSDNSGMMLEAYGTQKSDDTFKYIIRETDFLSAIEKAMEP